MVAMDYLDPQVYQPYFNRNYTQFPPVVDVQSKVQEALNAFHEAGWAHGDLRNTNIMVRIQADPAVVMLVDFDWAGVAGWHVILLESII